MSRTKRLLIIAYNFPPAGGSTFLRAFKFAKYLPQEGWDVHVLTAAYVEDGKIQFDSSLMPQLPDGVTIHRVGSFDFLFWYNRALALYRQRRIKANRPAVKSTQIDQTNSGKKVPSFSFIQPIYRIYRRLMTPDEFAAWNPLAYVAARRIMRSHGIDVVLTTGPPHSTHLIGKRLKRRTGVSWVMDYRDAWSTNPQFGGTVEQPSASAKHEQGCLSEVDAVVSTTDAIALETRTLLSPTAKPIYATIENGFDENDLPSDVSPPEGQFTIGYVGSLGGTRTPNAFLEGVARAIEQNAKLAHDLRLSFTGAFPDDARQFIEQSHLGPITTIHGYVAHSVAVRHLRSSDVVLVILWGREGVSAVPAKIYESLGADRPILGLVAEGPAAALLRETDAAEVVAPDDIEGISQAVQTLYMRWKNGILPRPRIEVRARFTRRAQTHRLAKILDRICSERRGSN